MNIYAISLDEVTTWQEDEDGEYQVPIVHHVIAPTPGRAKYLWIGYMESFDEDYRWTDPIRVRLLAKNVDATEGVDEDFLWALANVKDFTVLEYL